jgi:hypothetical protein
MAWDFLSRYLGNEPEEGDKPTPPPEKPAQPPTPFYVSHVPSDIPPDTAYLMDPDTKRKKSDTTEVEMRGKYPASMLNVGVGPFPKVARHLAKKTKLAQR